MQVALCLVDGAVWEASKFSLLSSSDLEHYRRFLSCSECKEFAWFRKESRHGHPAHFCAHHDDACMFKTEYIASDSGRGASLTTEDGISAGDTIIVNLDDEVGGDINVAPVQLGGNPNSGFGGVAYVGPKGNRESSQHFSLRKILHRLVRSQQFRDSHTQLQFYKKEGEILISGPVCEVIKSFEQVNATSFYSNEWRFYWGAIASAGRTQDGRLWLNSEGNSAVSIAIFYDIVDEFLNLFEIDDLEELAGAHVLVYGRCQGAGTGKPIVWCGSCKNIIIRKYKDA